MRGSLELGGFDGVAQGGGLLIGSVGIVQDCGSLANVNSKLALKHLPLQMQFTRNCSFF